MRLKVKILISFVLTFASFASFAQSVQSSGSATKIPGAEVTYQLPTDGQLPQTYRVTLATTLANDPDWIVSTFVAGEPRTVTQENQGRFTEIWNGLDENYMPVPAGEYGVKGIFMPAEVWPFDKQYHTLTAKLNGGPFALLPRPDQDTRPPVLEGDPCDSPPGSIAVTPGGRAVFYWHYLENGTNNLMLDLRKPVGLDQIISAYPSWGAGGGVWTCTDGETIWSHCEDGGIPFIYRADGKPFGGQQAKFRRDVFLPEGHVKGMAVWRGASDKKARVYVAERGRFGWFEYVYHGPRKRAVELAERLNRIRVLDGVSAAVLASVPLEEPISIKIQGDMLYALHLGGGKVGVSRMTLKEGLPSGTWTKLMTVEGIVAPTDLDVDSLGRIYLTSPEMNRAYRLDERGQIAQTFGRLNEQVPGRYDPLTLMRPTRLAAWTDEEGKDRIIIMETVGPARIAEWSPEGKLLREWQTLQPGGNFGYAVDPLNPSHIYVRGAWLNGHVTIAHTGGIPAPNRWSDSLIRFVVDYATGQWRVDAVWPEVIAGKKNGWESIGMGFPKIIHHQGRKYLAYDRGYAVYRFDGDRLIPSAAIIRVGKVPQIKHFIWRDKNGDGIVQETEWRDQELASPTGNPGLYGYWGENWQNDLSLVAVNEGGRDIWLLATEKIDEHGNPVFGKWNKLLTDPILEAKSQRKASSIRGGNEIYDIFNCAWRSVVASPDGGYFTNIRGGSFSANHGHEEKISRYVPDGAGGFRMRWRVGRAASVMPGNGAIQGSIHMSPPIHGLFGVIDQTRAGCHVFTEDGLYVDTLLLDGTHQKENVYGSPGEFFAGDVFRNTKDGKVYLAFGKQTPMIFEAKGWVADHGIKPIRSLSPIVILRAGDIADPPPLALSVRGGAGSAPVARVLPATGTPPTLEDPVWGTVEAVKFGDTEDRVEARLMYDRQNIYLQWKLNSQMPLPVRSLHPADRIFTHDRGATTMSFYLQGDPDARGINADGRSGDVRFIFGIFEDKGKVKPVALGVYPKNPQLANPVPTTYASPGGSVSFGHVGLLTDVEMDYRLSEDGKVLTLLAKIPKSSLPPQLLALSGDLRTMANFEATFRGTKKVWWSYGDGSASRETSDEPTEARLYPGSWASLTLNPVKDLPLRSWLVNGPWKSPTSYTGTDENKRKLQQGFDGSKLPPDDQKVAHSSISLKGPWNSGVWHSLVVRSEDRRLYPDNGEQLYKVGSTLYFVATWIWSPRDLMIELEFSIEDQNNIAAWLNGARLPEIQKAGGLYHHVRPKQTIKLNEGWNRLFLRAYALGYTLNFGAALKAEPDILWTLKTASVPPLE